MHRVKTLTVFLIILFCVSPLNAKGAKELSFREMREKMVETQLKGRGITDKRVISAMNKIPRHRFVPEDLRSFAYSDQILPIGQGQTISQPHITALMVSLLGLKGHESVLEIGTSSGYQTAVLGELSSRVFSIDTEAELLKTASERLRKMGYTNVHTKIESGYQGWPKFAPFDAIISTYAANKIPLSLLKQLKDGGKMVLPLGDSYPQKLTLIEQKGGKITRKYITHVIFMPMLRRSDPSQ